MCDIEACAVYYLARGMNWMDSKVEVCAGKGRLSEALKDSGYAVKPFDVLCLQYCT